MNESIKIMILDRGRVKVGYISRHPDLAFHWMIRNGRVIRRWGTQRGLEQLCSEGPTPETKLDSPADGAIPFRAVLEILDCEESKWASHLNGNETSPAPQKALTKAP